MNKKIVIIGIMVLVVIAIVAGLIMFLPNKVEKQALTSAKNFKGINAQEFQNRLCEQAEEMDYIVDNADLGNWLRTMSVNTNSSYVLRHGVCNDKGRQRRELKVNKSGC